MFKKISVLAVIILTVVSCIPKKTTKPESSLPLGIFFNGIVIRDNINVRSGASINGQKVGTVNDGEQVQVIQNKNGWYEIITGEKLTGWVRSDFIGTKSLSYNLKTEDFVDNTLKELDVEMFIDEHNPYAVVYMVLPEKYYSDKISAENFVNGIGETYQKKVYPGAVEIRILKQDKKAVFTKVNLSKKGAVNLKAPFLAQGRPYSFNLINGNSVEIKVLIPSGLSDDTLYDMSTDISANYGDDIRKIEIFFIEDNPDGIKYLSNKNYKPSNSNTCRFYFLEDSNGPDYKSNFCN